MGILDGFIQGVAEQSTNLLNNQIRDDAAYEKQTKLSQFNAELNDKRERALMELRQRMADAPLNRIGAKAKEFAGQDVPMEAEQPEPVKKTGGILNAGEMTGVDGKPIQTQGGGDRGLVTGLPGGSQSIEEMKANVLKDPSISEEDKRGVIAQLDAQAAQENQKNMADANLSVAGKTRKRTADEALAMAAEDAKVNDVPGYVAYESTIGKTDRENRRIDSLERKDDIREKKNDAEAADRRARADWLQTHQKEKLELDREIAKQKLERGVGDAKDPSEVAATKWLIANKDDPVAMQMWDKAHLSKSKDVGGIAADFMAKDTMLSAAEAVAKAKELVAATSATKQATADKPITQAEYAKLPSGAIFTAPDGSKRRKP